MNISLLSLCIMIDSTHKSTITYTQLNETISNYIIRIKHTQSLLNLGKWIVSAGWIFEKFKSLLLLEKYKCYFKLLHGFLDHFAEITAPHQLIIDR